MYLKSFYDVFKEQIVKRPLQPSLSTLEIGWGEKIRSGCGIAGQPLKVRSRIFSKGWGDHSDSRHVVHLHNRAVKFETRVGLIGNPNGRIILSVEDLEGNILGRTDVVNYDTEAFLFSVDLHGAKDFVIRSRSETEKDGTPAIANFVWGDPCVTLENGIKLTADDFTTGKFPICSFDYNGTQFVPDVSTHKLLCSTDEYEKYVNEDTTADGTLTLRTTITVYKDFPVIEWLPELLNRSDKPSGIVSNFQTLDLTLDLEDRSGEYRISPKGGSTRYTIQDVTLRRHLGSKCSQNDFVEETVMLRNRYPHNHLLMDTDEGRSSAVWLPYFGLDETDEQGLNIAVGWSGAWCAEFSMKRLMLDIKAGMPKTHFRVLPGETLRQVSMLIHHRNGLSVTAGQNQFRRFALKHLTPRNTDGSIRQMPLSFSSWGGEKTEQHLKYLQMLEKEKPGYDIYWVDAGWFGADRAVSDSEFSASDWSSTVGNWSINRSIHPQGFTPISDGAHKAGLKFMLWFELERVIKGVPVSKEHPEWMLESKTAPRHYLLNLGIPEAVDWAVDQVSLMIREHGLDYYRQDFNFNPTPFWQDNDSPDRIGVCEMKHIAGLYKFWDTLLEHFPEIMIDNCAAGGRRIDFETNRRSICLWRSDMLGRPWYDASEANLVMSTSLAHWVPVQGGGLTLTGQDDYSFFSGVISGGGANGAFCDSCKEDLDWLRSSLTAARRMRQLNSGDWYLLADRPETYKNIYAFQCDVPETGEGFFMAFRRLHGDESCRILSLRNIDPEARYEIEIYRDRVKQLPGSELQKYLLEMPEPRSVKLVFYRKLSS